MSDSSIARRDVLKSVLATIPLAIDWAALPVAKAGETDSDQFDAVIIGAGLGGLSCAAAFARQGFRALVIEQHDKPGGYATAFKRPAGFTFDVSLHSTYAQERNGIRNLIPGFPEITDVSFAPLPYKFHSGTSRRASARWFIWLSRERRSRLASPLTDYRAPIFCPSSRDVGTVELSRSRP